MTTSRTNFPVLWLALIGGLVVIVVVLMMQKRDEIDALIINNAAEVQTLDPSIMRGVPEHRVALAIFEGLCGYDAKTLDPIPGVAERWEISEDGKTYTFHLRECTWSDGTPVTAHDFVYAWKRILKPETAADYAHMVAHHLKNGRAYHEWALAEGALRMFEEKRVEPKNRKKTFQGLRGACQDQIERLGKIPTENDEEKQQIAAIVEKARSRPTPSLDDVGGRAVDDRTLVMELEHVAPYILQLQGHYSFYPLPRHTIEKHGEQKWTRPENIVSNGPYILKKHVKQDYILLEKNPRYWNAAEIKQQYVKFLPVDKKSTAFSMYESKEIHWLTDVPRNFVRELMERSDYHSDTFFTTYFYSLDVTKPALNNVRVRKALSFAIDREKIVNNILQSGETAAGTLVPPGVAGYVSPEGHTFNPEKARQLLAEAGYPNGEGFPEFDVIYNTDESHKNIAAAIQEMWRTHLGIKVGLRNVEWGTYLELMSKIDYHIMRRGWVGDYIDPNTFLEMFVTGGGNNNSNWGNDEYDRIVLKEAPSEPDPQKRFELFVKAEKILMDEAPIIPIYFYVSHNMYRTDVKGIQDTLLDVHPLHRVMRASGHAP